MHVLLVTHYQKKEGFVVKTASTFMFSTVCRWAATKYEV